MEKLSARIYTWQAYKLSGSDINTSLSEPEPNILCRGGSSHVRDWQNVAMWPRAVIAYFSDCEVIWEEVYL